MPYEHTGWLLAAIFFAIGYLVRSINNEANLEDAYDEGYSDCEQGKDYDPIRYRK